MSNGVQRRPAVSIVLPFFGNSAEADTALAALGRIRLGPGDEVLIADNTHEGTLVSRPSAARFDAFVCEVRASAYAARNLASARAHNDWLLFLDADCRPEPDLLDRYFDDPPATSCGAVAGQVLGAPEQHGLIPRYIRSRQHLDQVWLATQHPYRPMAVTANLLVRTSAWKQVGGFAEGTRSGADGDFCWRLMDAGWTLELREAALVHHEHRSTLAALLRQSMRDGAGARWLSHRYPGHGSGPRLGRELPRAAAGALVWLVRGQGERAAFKLVDGLWSLAAVAGSWQSNASPRTPDPGASVTLAERFPTVDEPFVADAGTGGRPVRVEAVDRPDRAHWNGTRAFDVRFCADDGPGVRLAALARIVGRRPQALRLVVREPRRAAALAPAALRALPDAPSVQIFTTHARQQDAALLAGLAGAPVPRVLEEA